MMNTHELYTNGPAVNHKQESIVSCIHRQNKAVKATNYISFSGVYAKAELLGFNAGPVLP